MWICGKVRKVEVRYRLYTPVRVLVCLFVCVCQSVRSHALHLLPEVNVPNGRGGELGVAVEEEGLEIAALHLVHQHLAQRGGEGLLVKGERGGGGMC